MGPDQLREALTSGGNSFWVIKNSGWPVGFRKTDIDIFFSISSSDIDTDIDVCRILN